ncbi:MAG: hypothetical protein WBG10_15070 [Pseudolabrys sp.]
MNQVRQIPVLELDRRQINGDLQWPRPRRSFTACGTQNPFAELKNKSAFLGQWNEGAGRHEPVAWMIPARQRLKSGDVSFDVRLRLVVQLNLIPQDRQT